MGTLVDLEPPAPLLCDELARRFGLTVALERAAEALRAEIRHYRAHMDRGRDGPSLSALRRDCARVLRDALAPPAGAGDLDLDLGELTEALVDSLRFRVHDDAHLALARARASGAEIVVVSNWDISLGDVLERLGLAPLLRGVVTSAAVGAAKPAPAIFEHALGLAAVAPAAARHVGDSLAEDVRGAQACGIDAVLLVRPGAALPGADPVGVSCIGGLDELRWP